MLSFQWLLRLITSHSGWALQMQGEYSGFYRSYFRIQLSYLILWLTLAWHFSLPDRLLSVIVLPLGKRKGKATEAGEAHTVFIWHLPLTKHCPKHERTGNRTARSPNVQSSEGGIVVLKKIMYVTKHIKHTKYLIKLRAGIYRFIILVSIFLYV